MSSSVDEAEAARIREWLASLTPTQQLEVCAQVTAFSTRLKDFGGILRDAVNAHLAAKYEAEQTATTKVVVGGETVGQMTVALSKDRFEVTDRDAYLDWVERHRPDQIETVIQVRPAFEKVHLARLQHGPDGEAVDETGEIVPGVTFRRGGAPETVRLTWEKETRTRASGQDRALDHLLAGDRLHRVLYAELPPAEPVLDVDADDAEGAA